MEEELLSLLLEELLLEELLSERPLELLPERPLLEVPEVFVMVLGRLTLPESVLGRLTLPESVLPLLLSGRVVAPVLPLLPLLVVGRVVAPALLLVLEVLPVAVLELMLPGVDPLGRTTVASPCEPLLEGAGGLYPGTFPSG